MSKIKDVTLEELKKQHKHVFRITVVDKSAVFRMPSRAELSQLSNIKDPMKYNESFMETCFLQGDRELIDDDAYFFSAQGELSKILNSKVAVLEKL